MKNINLTAFISGIALIISILSPIITTCINNHHQTRMKNIEFYYLHRANVIENYINSIGALLQNPCSETREQYSKCFGEVFIYLPDKLWETVERLDSELRQNPIGICAKDSFKSLCKELSKIPPRFKN